MRRFNYDDNEEYREDVDKFFDKDNEDMPPEYRAIMEEENAIQHFQLSLVNRDLNHRLLRSAIRMAEKSFLWRFYSVDTRMNIIDRIYNKFKMLEGDEDDEE